MTPGCILPSGQAVDTGSTGHSVGSARDCAAAGIESPAGLDTRGPVSANRHSETQHRASAAHLRVRRPGTQGASIRRLCPHQRRRRSGLRLPQRTPGHGGGGTAGRRADGGDPLAGRGRGVRRRQRRRALQHDSAVAAVVPAFVYRHATQSRQPGNGPGLSRFLQSTRAGCLDRARGSIAIAGRPVGARAGAA